MCEIIHLKFSYGKSKFLELNVSYFIYVSKVKPSDCDARYTKLYRISVHNKQHETLPHKTQRRRKNIGRKRLSTKYIPHSDKRLNILPLC